MKTLIRLISATVLMLALQTMIVVAQSKEDEKYRKASEKIRKEVWDWNRPEFKQTEVPEKYANASRITIAHHTELIADSRSKLAHTGLLGFTSKKELTITEIVREMVKVNDKSAVDFFSELSFTRFERKSGFVRGGKSTSFVGVRIIKPNKTVKEVDADEMVLTKDAKNEKKAKLAISDLEPGDIIDYFVATELELVNDYDAKAYNVLLFDDVPVMHYSFHGQLGKKYAIDYRSYNGAPDLSVTKNSDKEVIIDVEKKDMAPFESSLWVAPALQLPLIRMNISLGYRGPQAKFMGTSKPGEVSKNLDTEEVVNSLSNNLSQRFYASYITPQGYAEWSELVSDAKKKAKAMGLNYKAMSQDEQAAHLFYTTRFSRLLSFNINKMEESINAGDYTYNGLAMAFSNILKAGDVDGGVVAASSRTGFRMKEILDEDDLETAAYIESSKKILYLSSIYDHPFDVPSILQGVRDTRAITFRKRAMVMSANALNKFASSHPGFAIPASKAPANSHLEELHITVNPGDTKLSVKRKSIVKGLYKYDLQRQLILYEDYYESERILLGEENSLIETLEDNKKTKNYVAEVKNAFAEARKKQKDSFIEEAKSKFEQDVTDMTKFKVVNMGVRHTSPDFIYSSEFSLDGLIKKAGNNLIFEIGKIQGEPLSIRDEQRTRKIDVYMPFPRSIGYDLRIQIPEGYSVEGIDALKINVENETGYFKTDASVNGQVLTVTIKKSYLHGYEPAANWDKMLAFIDASNDFTNAKLLFKKN